MVWQRDRLLLQIHLNQALIASDRLQRGTNPLGAALTGSAGNGQGGVQCLRLSHGWSLLVSIHC